MTEINLAEMQKYLETIPLLTRTIPKLELCSDIDKPKFEKDYEYIDYALSVLERSVFHPEFGPMLNDLECRNEDLKKSVAKAENFRKLGNYMWKNRKMGRALDAYILSISFAPPGSSQLALAYGNRSALLFYKHYYKECLEDIERALENDYPQEKKDTLLKRQVEAKKLLPTQKKVAYHGVVPTIPNINPNIPSAADSIQINENKEYGRHIVATRTINPGEVLLVEKPYSCFVSPYTNGMLHCSECFELCYNLIQCKKCAGVLYCSKECRKKAFVAYHRYECTIMTTYGYDLIEWNATRMTFKAIKEYNKKETNTDEYRSDRYLELSKLMLDKGDRVLMSLLANATGAAKVFYALKKYTDIFAELDMDDKENVLKDLLFKNVCITNLNKSGIQLKSGRYGKIIGSAVYSVFSLFNHACAENVARSIYGSTMVLKAMKKIPKGEQCFVNYGVIPTETTVQERQKILERQYFFTCKCLACEQNWPFATERLVEDPAIATLCAIKNTISSSENLSEQQKHVLLEETIQAVEKAETKYPFLTYLYCVDIYRCVLFDGNQTTSF